MRLALLSGVVLWAGATLLLAELRWFSRRSLADRLSPYTREGSPAASPSGVLSVGSLRDLAAPAAAALGARLARLAGVEEPLAARLARVHADVDPTTFRVRQLQWAGLGAAGGAAFAAALGVPALAGLGCLLGGGALAFLLVEQRLAERSAAWRRTTCLELPVVAEQLGMLLSAGWSLGAALQRLADRGTGCVGRDLRWVCARMRHGLSDVEALREWAARVDVDAVERLVAVLSLNREAGDLGRLISEEARSIRRDVQRERIELIERREQQVWIPVTVATLVPGVLCLAVPFVEALRVFSGG